MPSDRTLNITATPTLIWHSADNIDANLTYQQTGSTPNMPNRVDRQSGNIDLGNMPNNANYTDNVDIAITLNAANLYDPQGNLIPAAWANIGDPVTNPMNGVPPNTPWAWFCANPILNFPYSTTPVLIPNMSAIRNSDTVVTIDDNTAKGSGQYIFCLGLVLWPLGRRYFITIDPVISDKGVSKPPSPADPI